MGSGERKETIKGKRGEHFTHSMYVCKNALCPTVPDSENGQNNNNKKTLLVCSMLCKASKQKDKAKPGMLAFSFHPGPQEADTE